MILYHDQTTCYIEEQIECCNRINKDGCCCENGPKNQNNPECSTVSKFESFPPSKTKHDKQEAEDDHKCEKASGSIATHTSQISLFTLKVVCQWETAQKIK